MGTTESTYRLREDERKFVFSLIEQVTGTCQRGAFRREVLVANVERRIRYVGAKTLKAYLSFALRDPRERQLLVSALTIHTTSWFREFPHFIKLQAHVRQRLQEQGMGSLTVLCGGCSTGEEVFSIAFVLEQIRRENPQFEYHVHGIDIDPISIAHAERAIFARIALSSIPEEYRRFLNVGQGKVAGFFTPIPEVRRRCSFEVEDIRRVATRRREIYDSIFCRNVLIYFAPLDAERLVTDLLSTLKVDGMLLLGHSEAINPVNFGLRFVGDSTYVKRRQIQQGAARSDGECRVLVVDDSPFARKVIERSLEKSGLTPISVASAEEASEFLERHTVDVITLDVTMPGLDGPTWLNSRRLAGLGVPVVIVSESGPSQALSILGALENGAQDYIEKSSIASEEFGAKLLAIAKTYRPRASRQVRAVLPVSQRRVVSGNRPDIILVGASTGGTEAVMKLLQCMPHGCPPILVVQHISSYFARAFAQRLAANARLSLGDSCDGGSLEPGRIYVADDDRHMGVSGRRGKLSILRSDGPPINRHRPSVDYLFKSAAMIPGLSVAAILLTGMGADGAVGLKELHDKGARTMAQDEQSCVVFGMPREAIALGAVDIVGNPAELRQYLECQLFGAVTEQMNNPEKNKQGVGSDKLGSRDSVGPLLQS